MSGLSEFFNMGGYAFYVWTSYGVTAVVLAANVLVPWQRRRKLIDDLKRRWRARRNA